MPAARFAFLSMFYSFRFFLFVFVLSSEPKQNQGRGVVDHKLVQATTTPPVILLVAVPGRFCFSSLVILDVALLFNDILVKYRNIENR